MVDITDQKEVQERLRDLATHDTLTGIYNRRYLEEVVRKEVDRAQRYARPLSIAMVDADHFKRINDTHGHQVGDEVLRAVSERCQKGLRSNDVLARYGGEEFVMVFPETSLGNARTVAERVRVAVGEVPITVGDRALAVTVSIGLAALGQEQDFSALLERADHALYAAKQSGRNRVQTAQAE
jgi:diguanylate cyclase (GGDEF)-like protein